MSFRKSKKIAREYQKYAIDALDNEHMEERGIPFVPFFEQNSGKYTPETAAWLVANCMTAQEFFQEEKIPKDKIQIEDVTKLHWFNLIRYQLGGYIARPILENDDEVNRIVIALRGTARAKEWLQNAFFAQVDFPFGSGEIQGRIMKSLVNYYTGSPRLSIPFIWERRDSLREQILQALQKHYFSSSKKNRLYLTGFSLGSALVTVIAADLAVQFPELEIVSYHFGGPRIGDPDFASSFENFFKNQRKANSVIYRVENASDIVPTIPLAVIPTRGANIYFEHLGIAISQLENTDRNIVGKAIFDKHAGNLIANHALCTHLSGSSNGKFSCGERE